MSYEDIGGLEAELQKVREIIEFPMKYPELFKKLGIDAPKGLLLVGPSGTGKTLIARAVASEVKAHFIHVNGPEIMTEILRRERGEAPPGVRRGQRERTEHHLPG